MADDTVRLQKKTTIMHIDKEEGIRVSPDAVDDDTFNRLYKAP